MENWKKISEELVYSGYRKILRKKFKLPTGQVSDWDVVQNGELVYMLALTPQNETILVKQFRPGPEKILLDLPGGFVDPGNTPLEAAQHELREETGYTGTFQLVATTVIDGYSTGKKHHFVVTNCLQVGEPIMDPDGNMPEAVCMTLQDFREHLKSSSVADITTGYLALDHLKLL